MSILRFKHNKENPYVVINKEGLWDENLSLDAIGLWARLLSRPDNWEIYVTELCNSCKCGETKMYRIINELIDNGYAYREQTKGKNGRYEGYDYVIFEKKKTSEEIQKMFPHRRNPDTDDPSVENQELLSTDPKPSTKEQVVCYSEAESSKTSQDDKEKIILDSLTFPETLEKTNTKGQTLKINLKDIFHFSVKSKKDWRTTEIHEAWKILHDYKGFVNDGKHFIAGTIKNLRNKIRSEHMSKGKECQNHQQMQFTESKKTSSEQDTQEHRSVGAILAEMGMPCPFG